SRPKKDRDTLTLACNPTPADGCRPDCPPNPDGGPRELVLTVGPTGTDLDNGWTGSSHNFILVPNGEIHGCLTSCDSTTDTVCDFEAVTGDGTPTGATFGAPLPLLASNTPV